MKCFAVFSREYPELAKAELRALNNKVLFRDTLVVFSDAGLVRRSAFIRTAFALIFSAQGSVIPKIDWNKHITGSYCVRVHGNKGGEKNIAKAIHAQLRSPVVDLENPGTQIQFFFTKSHIYCGKLLWEQYERFEERRAHLRAAHSPVSLHPKLARAMVNLTGVKTGILLDPFCGTGGILIEAGLMGFPVVGCDIDEKYVAMAKKNLSMFELHESTVIQSDALTLTGSYPYIATDLPYGKNTKTQDLMKLYRAFFLRLRALKTRKAVVGMPSTVACGSLLKGAGYKVQGQFTIYIHKSLSKKIIVLERA